MGQPYPLLPQPRSLPPYPPRRSVRRPRNFAAVVGFGWALAGAVFSLLPIIGIIAWVLSPVGLVLSVVGLGMATRREGVGRGLAVAGTILGVVGLIVCTIWASVFSNALQNLPAPAPPSAPPAAPADLDRAAGPLTLEITGTAATADVIRTGADGTQVMTRERLPFRATIPAPATATVSLIGSLSADDGGAGPITCTITQAGRVITTSTATGPHPTAVCTAW